MRSGLSGERFVPWLSHNWVPVGAARPGNILAGAPPADLAGEITRS